MLQMCLGLRIVAREPVCLASVYVALSRPPGATLLVRALSLNAAFVGPSLVMTSRSARSKVRKPCCTFGSSLESQRRSST